jgi:hypothetical protein
MKNFGADETATTLSATSELAVPVEIVTMM